MDDLDLRRWAIEQANGDVKKAREILDFLRPVGAESRTQKRWSDEEKEFVRAALESGEPVRQITRMLNERFRRSVQPAAIFQMRARLNIPARFVNPQNLQKARSAIIRKKATQ